MSFLVCFTKDGAFSEALVTGTQMRFYHLHKYMYNFSFVIVSIMFLFPSLMYVCPVLSFSLMKWAGVLAG